MNYHKSVTAAVHGAGADVHAHGGTHSGSHTPVIGGCGGTGIVAYALNAIPKTYKSKTISNLTFSVNEEYKHTHGLGGQGQG